MHDCPAVTSWSELSQAAFGEALPDIVQPSAIHPGLHRHFPKCRPARPNEIPVLRAQFMSRGTYWIWVTGLIIASGLLLTIVKSSYGGDAEYDVGRMLLLTVVAICLALAALRLRDSGHSELWAYLVLVPFLNLVAIIAVGIPRSAELSVDATASDNPF